MTWDPFSVGEIALKKPWSLVQAQKVESCFNYLYQRKLILKDPPAISLNTTSPAGSWTDRTLTPDGSDVIEYALLGLEVSGHSPITGFGGLCDFVLEVRKKDDANWVFGSNCPGVNAQLYANNTVAAYAAGRAVALVPVNASNQYQYRASKSLSAGVWDSCRILFLAYYRKES